MIFWILVGLIVLAFILGGWIDNAGYWELGMACAASFATALVGAIVITILFFCNVNGIEGEHVGTETKTLKSLGDTSGNRGGYYLGGGYSGSVRVLNYVTDTGGDIRLEQARAVNSSIREDAGEKPYVDIHEWDYHMGWLLPWQIGHEHSYDFHIPKDSVLETYTIDNK